MDPDKYLYEVLDRQLYRVHDSNIKNTEDERLSSSDLNLSFYSDSVSPIVDPADIGSGGLVGEIEVISGTIQSSNWVEGVSGWRLSPTGADINGGLNVTSINIGGSDATSAHIDTDGNFWLGAATYADAPAKISNAGAAVFKNVQIGGATIQYVITNSGIFSFGDGSDGDATFANQGTAPTGTTKTDNTNGATIYRLDRDVYYDDATLDSTVTLDPNGYRIFVQGTLTVNGHIKGDGPAGGAGTGGGKGFGTNAGGTATSLADGYLKGSVAPGNGGYGGEAEGSGQNGFAGSNRTNSLGSNAAAGGNGGENGFGIGAENPGTGAAGGTVTGANVALIANWHLATLLDVSSTGSTVKFDNSASAGGGGGGTGGVDLGYTGNSNAKGGGGGAGGTAGRIVAIYARNIVIGAAGSITSNGGNGGAGGAGGSVTDATPNSLYAGGGGGGGGGGNGGIVILVYNTLTNSGSITVTAGTGGAAGAAGVHSGDGGGASGVAGTAGSNGSTGIIYQFQLSL